MAKSTKLKSTKKRVKVKDLQAEQKKVSGKDMKQVKGGGFGKASMKDVMITSVVPKG